MTFLLLQSIAFFSQNKELKIQIASINSDDSLPNERKFTITYHIENLTNKDVSFFLKENKYMPAHSGSMLPILLFKLYQENEVLEVSGILKNFTKNDTTNPYRNLNSKDNNIRKKAFDKLFNGTSKSRKDSLKAAIKNGATIESYYTSKSSKEFMNSICKLKPKEVKKYSHTFYWDKTNYYIENEMEYVLEEHSKFYMELYLILMKEEVKSKLIPEDYKKIMTDKTFIQGVYISNKIELNFKL